MKSPITGKEMKLCQRTESLTFRKEQFLYIHNYYECEETGECFTTTELDDLNLNQVYNQFREKHHIPGPAEIKKLRKNLGLSAAKMSIILGFGPNGYRNYEKGEVPSQVQGNMLRMVLKNLSFFKDLVEDNDSISELEKNQIILNINKEKERSANQEYSRLQSLLGVALPGSLSGYLKPDIEKIVAMIVYFAKTMKPSKTVMNKLLFYADFYHYRTTGFSMSGVRYVAIDYGPVPDRYLAIFDHAIHHGFVGIEEKDYGKGFVAGRFFATKSLASKEVFSNKEIAVLKKVATRFKSMNATQLTELSHMESAWKANQKERKLIDYNYSFELKNL